MTHPDEIAALRNPLTRNEAFDQLVDRMMKPLYGYARRIVVDGDDAEDVVQEAFIKAYDRIGSFRGDTTALNAWLYRITTNAALSLLRHRSRSIFSSLDRVGHELSARVEEESREEADRLEIRFQQAVLELPVKQRLVFNLRYWDELSYAEIAVVLGQKEATLKVNYHYAVEKLKEKLKQEVL